MRTNLPNQLTVHENFFNLYRDNALRLFGECAKRLFLGVKEVMMVLMPLHHRSDGMLTEDQTNNLG